MTDLLEDFRNPLQALRTILRDENIPHVIIGGLAVSQAKILSRVCFASREGSLKAKLAAVLETPARSAMSLIVTRICFPPVPCSRSRRSMARKAGVSEKDRADPGPSSRLSRSPTSLGGRSGLSSRSCSFPEAPTFPGAGKSRRWFFPAKD